MIHIGAPQVSSPTLKNRPLRGGGGDKYFGITKMQKNGLFDVLCGPAVF
jgi:hypothetical protein